MISALFKFRAHLTSCCTCLALCGHFHPFSLLLVNLYCIVYNDTASLDPGSSVDFIAHRILLGAGIYGIENINSNIDLLPRTGFTLLVMPLMLAGGSGAPARVVATVPV